ncbi:MAG: 16S rRNA (uracil(1498)-N(3))-methyltransferase [Firmicutes bacterium]|nr:16S rRNA (uracil(1498)-N(3))-methyltransferase [Bacillota bacterium]MDY6161250.1 16S rRNA (uracil(1498)-N(3))-methyltransferase [Candidatus Faecousia sp.]
MTRFFVEAQDLSGDTLHLTGENFQHAKVLRLKPGERMLVCDGQGEEALCAVRQVGAAELELEVLERRESETEAAVRVSVYMAFPKADKLEHVIQKATELGAYEIVAFPSARCVSRPDEKSLKKKLERWQKIAASAAEQSGRGRIPEVVTLGSFKEALGRAKQADKALLFYENEHAVTLRMALESGAFQTVSLLTGPEGGLEEAEVDQARKAGLQVCTLGSRILRCETAPLCALSAVMYAAGEF